MVTVSIICCYCRHYLLNEEVQGWEWKMVFFCLRHQEGDRGCSMGSPLPKSLSSHFLNHPWRLTFVYLLVKQFFKQWENKRFLDFQSRPIKQDGAPHLQVRCAAHWASEKLDAPSLKNSWKCGNMSWDILSEVTHGCLLCFYLLVTVLSQRDTLFSIFKSQNPSLSVPASNTF